MKKIIFSLIAIFFLFINKVFALNMPVSCKGLPGCNNGDGQVHDEKIFSFIGKITSEGIKYIAVFSVIALMLAGLNFVVGGGLSGEEEKVKKAKSWILWALVGVILSISAWGIINVLNNLQIVN